MSKKRLLTVSVILCAAVVSARLDSKAHGQHGPATPIHFRVSGEAERLEMTVRTSRILTLPYNVPDLLVQNPEIVEATPLSPNQIQLHAAQMGATALNLWDEEENVHTIDVRVVGDVRQLQEELNRLFPAANIKARSLNSSLLLTGHVSNADNVNRIVEVSKEYFPKVINHMTVGGVQTIALHVKVIEVSRTKLRQFGIDWSIITADDFITQTVSGITNPQLSFGIVDGSFNFTAFIDLLRQNSLAKLLSEPTVITTSGRPASFNSGGQVPVPLSGGLGVTTVEYREFGTTVDFVPIVLGNGKIKLEVRPEITEVDPSLRDPVTGTPGFRSRRVDTSVEMEPGQTLALAGLIQTRMESENKGFPWIADVPFFGAPFRRVQESANEVELLILVTPQIVAPMDPHEVPPCGPGEMTTHPNDVELYWRGYLEVPKCCFDGSCVDCRAGRGAGGAIGPFGPPGYHNLPQQGPAGSNRIERVPAESPGPRPAPSTPDPEPSAAIRPRPAPTGNRPAPTGNTSRHVYPRTSAPEPVVTRINDSTPRGLEQVPVRTPERQIPHIRTNRTFKPVNSENIPPREQPQLFGPIGYDVIN